MATCRKWVCAVWSFTAKTTNRTTKRAQRGLASLGATQLTTELDGANVVEYYRVEANGRTLGELQRILGSYGISRVYHGHGRVLHGTGAGTPVRNKQTPAIVYRHNRKALDANLFTTMQRLRLAGVAGFEQANNPKAKTTRQGQLLASLQRIVRLQRKLVQQWDSERIDASNEDIVNGVLAQLAKRATDIVTLLSNRESIPANPLEVVCVASDMVQTYLARE